MLLLHLPPPTPPSFILNVKAQNIISQLSSLCSVLLVAEGVMWPVSVSICALVQTRP